VHILETNFLHPADAVGPGEIEPLWVRSRIGRALPGWRPYDAWAFSPEGVGDAYLTEDQARLHVGITDEQGGPVADGIRQMREVLRAPRGVVRLVGLSGVGKTRLVQALFDARVGESSLHRTLAVYTDMAEGPDPPPAAMATDLIVTRRRAILVVDNCPPDLHQRLSERCRAPDSTLSVITVEYDIQDDQPEGTDVFRLEPSSAGLIEKLIVRRFSSSCRCRYSRLFAVGSAWSSQRHRWVRRGRSRPCGGCASAMPAAS
jgi:hypothetical protein